ncbi:MAG: hypothetical protein LBQ38_03360, partial [Spirochaetaceae bacterium]|nr:hypothetical protein [Spirochaetaceae bacterium]
APCFQFIRVLGNYYIAIIDSILKSSQLGALLLRHRETDRIGQKYPLCAEKPRINILEHLTVTHNHNTIRVFSKHQP